MKKSFLLLFSLLLALSLLLSGFDLSSIRPSGGTGGTGDAGGAGGSFDGATGSVGVSDTVDLGAYGTVPAYAGTPFVVIGDGIPKFTAEELTTTSFERYAPLDSYGRCGVCVASIGIDLMPTEDRGDINNVTPTAWHSVKYDIVSGKYLYNRCHLIGFQLAGENDNARNLITGTRELNIEGMLPFENMIADYVKETENHVLYRVTPVFEGTNLLATGVLMEGYSIEDEGEGVCFVVFAYNAQPGIALNYADGTSALSGEELPEAPTIEQGTTLYVLNTRSLRIHRPECSSVEDIAEHNKKETYETYASLTGRGYKGCGSCKPE